MQKADKVAELISKCLQARDMAYCPYSHFPVGAAILAADGAIITGCNVENASYGLTMCAERTAIQRAVAEGHRQFTAIAVTCDVKDRFVGPCGACRQVLVEFGSNWAVYLTKPDGTYKETTLGELLPFAFSLKTSRSNHASTASSGGPRHVWETSFSLTLLLCKSHCCLR